jgi:hypothetical protein
MAAHVLTALEQEVSLPNFPLLKVALDFTPWAGQLSIDDYSRLKEIACATNYDAFTAFFREVYPKYLEEWESLNKPRTYEDWVKEKYLSNYQEN